MQLLLIKYKHKNKGFNMENERKISEIRILFDCIFELVRYYQYETGGKYSTVEYLCESLDEKFKDLTKDF
jgi:hypothetical protein